MLAELNSLKIDLQRNRAFIPDDVATGFINIAGAIAKCYSTGATLGTAKGAALQAVLKREILLAGRSGIKIGLVARHENSVEAVRHWLNQRSLNQNAEVFSPRSLPENQSFDHLFCVSWPSGDAVKSLASKLAAPRITFVGYPCERLWLRHAETRLRWRASVATVSSGDKAD
jgi:hypothetical protein